MRSLSGFVSFVLARILIAKPVPTHGSRPRAGFCGIRAERRGVIGRGSGKIKKLPVFWYGIVRQRGA
jgi:hypothetical protein